MMSRDLKDRDPDLKILHAVDSRFRNVVSYKTYRLFDKLHTYNWKMALRTGNYDKPIERQ